MAESSSERDPVESLAEEFVERFRRGECPAVSEYTQRYPAWAERIRKVFPAVVLMEGIRPAGLDPTGPGTSSPVALDERTLERLGDYRILREVGRGGMGIVYEAEQVSLGRHVALKVLPSHALLDPKHLQRFQREARAAARLHHTNIVPVYGVGEDAGLHYYVMQFIQGLGLDKVLTELRRLRRTGAAPESRPADEIDTPGTLRQASGVEVSAVGVAQALLTGPFVPGPPEKTDPDPSGPIPEPSIEEVRKAAPIPTRINGTPARGRLVHSLARPNRGFVAPPVRPPVLAQRGPHRHPGR
jgi:hypothetical protein